MVFQLHVLMDGRTDRPTNLQCIIEIGPVDLYSVLGELPVRTLRNIVLRGKETIHLRLTGKCQ